MAGHIERKEVLYMLILVGFVFGVFYFYKGRHFLNDFSKASDTQRAATVSGQRAKAKQNFEKSVEASLNQLLEDVYIEMQEYRKRRKILDDLIKPSNLRDAQYIAESYQVSLQTIPDLKKRSNRIIQIFSAKDAEIKAMIKGRSATAQKNILQSWARVKGEQVDLYVDYFVLEQEILTRYETLMQLYFENRNGVTYSESSNQLMIKPDALNAKALNLTQEIKSLKQQQSALTK